MAFEVLGDADQQAKAQLPDTARFLSSLESLAVAAPLGPEQRAACEAFRWDQDFFVSRAPGRMDVMGGIADYSGALVLQMPTAEACHVALQRQPPHGGAVDGTAGHEAGCLTIISFLDHPSSSAHRSPVFHAPLTDLFPSGALGACEALQYAEAQAYFKRDPSTSWAAYVAGCLLVLTREEGLRLEPGESVAAIVSSDVPEGKGVSSSAAVEVSTMSALAAACGMQLEGRRLAILCQMVENLVVGAPCGIMDQMASALGEPSRLLALLCQPAEVQGCVDIPPHMSFWGVDSGVRHSVGGADYGSVRVGAFMGLRVASEIEHGAKAASGQVQPLRGGYLVNVSPSEFLRDFQPLLPESILGAEFRQRYGGHFDSVTSIQDGTRYAVRVPATHPVLDHARVRTFRQLLLAAAAAAASPSPSSSSATAARHCGDGGGRGQPEGELQLSGQGVPSGLWSQEQEEQLSLLGELMFQTHDSYGACGLGCNGTDRLVQLVREEMAQARAQGRPQCLYGAKITGGGSGGTVCILGTARGGREAVMRVAARYASEVAANGSSGSHAADATAAPTAAAAAAAAVAAAPKVFEGSSVGAVKFGALRVRMAGATAALQT